MWSKWPWCPHSNVWHRLLLPTGLSASTSRRATQPAPRTLLWLFLSRDFSQINQPTWVIRSPTSERHYLSKTFNFQSVCQGRLEIWNLIYFEQVCGGDDNINHLIFISTCQSLFRSGPESHGWAGRKCQVKSDKQKKGGGDVKWHLEGRRSRAGRDHLSQEAAEAVGEENVSLSDSRWWSSVIVFLFFYFFIMSLLCFKANICKENDKIRRL